MRLTRRQFLARLRRVSDAVSARVGQHDGSKYARGLAGEGYAGGYLAALRDVEAAMTHGYPSDQWGFWAAARKTEGE